MQHADFVGADVLRELGVDGGGDLADALEILCEAGPSPCSTTRGAMSSISGAGRSASGRGIGFLKFLV